NPHPHALIFHMLLSDVCKPGLFLLQLPLKSFRHCGQCLVEQHPLIGCRDAKQATRFPCRPPLDVSQDNELALTRWKYFYGLLKVQANFLGKQSIFWEMG